MSKLDITNHGFDDALLTFGHVFVLTALNK